jgi:hypothetical protein
MSIKDDRTVASLGVVLKSVASVGQLHRIEQLEIQQKEYTQASPQVLGHLGVALLEVNEARKTHSCCFTPIVVDEYLGNNKDYKQLGRFLGHRGYGVTFMYHAGDQTIQEAEDNPDLMIVYWNGGCGLHEISAAVPHMTHVYTVSGSKCRLAARMTYAFTVCGFEELGKLEDATV